MKFTDVKTLNHLLKEYGNTPGKNMPTANKELGFQGDNSLSIAKKIKPDGTPKYIPSNLSNTPPCPGKYLPKSLRFAFLFK